LHPLLLLLLMLLLLPVGMLDIRSNFGGPHGLQGKPQARSVAAIGLGHEWSADFCSNLICSKKEKKIAVERI
jgi:hypothetical protein